MKHTCKLLTLLPLIWGAMAPDTTAQGVYDNEIFDDGAPTAIWFRTQTLASTNTYDQLTWVSKISRLDGICPNVPTPVHPYIQYLIAHPQYPSKLIYSMTNGSSRGPTYSGTHSNYFPGHWLYYAGSTLLGDLPGNSSSGGSEFGEIRVAHPNRFLPGDDAVICSLDASGGINWLDSEYVYVRDVIAATNTLEVDRGQYFSTGKDFAMGSHIAPIVPDPFQDDVTTWMFNFSLSGPVDAQGDSLVAARLDHVVSMYQGQFSDYEGVNFDVVFRDPLHKDDTRKVDIDNNRIPDKNEGVDYEWLMDEGAAEFLSLLRQAMGEDFLITIDGQKVRTARSVGVTNGIEMERFPCGQEEFAHPLWDWSSGVNRLLFWNEHAVGPRMNYINHKFNSGHYTHQDFGWNIERASLAMGPMFDFHLTFFTGPDGHDGTGAQLPDDDDLLIYDEVDRGVDDISNWLGQPVEPARRLALQSSDLLGGTGLTFPSSFTSQMQVINGTSMLMCVPGGPHTLRLAPDSDDVLVKVKLPPLDITEGDLVVFCEVWTDPLDDPLQRYRILEMKCNGRYPEPRSPNIARANMHTQPYLAEFYWRRAGNDPDPATGTREVNLVFRLPKNQGGKPFYLRNLTIHSAAPALQREFENGMVLVNPSLDDVTFSLAPNGAVILWRRLQGSPDQDPATNDGQVILSPDLTLSERDALFLIRPGS